MKFITILLAVIFAGAASVQGGGLGIGIWGGHRTVGFMIEPLSSPMASMMEFGGYFAFQIIPHLAIRGYMAYNTGRYVDRTTTTDPGGTRTYETKESYSGFPIEFNILPTFHIGDKLTLRTGGGFAYHSYSVKISETRTSGGVITTTTYPSAKISGIGAQFLFTAESKLSDNLALEFQYKKDNSSLTFKWTYNPTPTEIKEKNFSSGSASDTYRIGISFYLSSASKWDVK